MIFDAAHKESTENCQSKTSKNSEIWSYGNDKEYHAFSHDTVVDMRENFDVSSEYLNNL